MIVSVLLSFINNAIGHDEAALKKRLIKQVFLPKLTLEFIYNDYRFGLDPSSALEFAFASVPPSSVYGTPLPETSGARPRIFGKAYFASSPRFLLRHAPAILQIIKCLPSLGHGSCHASDIGLAK